MSQDSPQTVVGRIVTDLAALLALPEVEIKKAIAAAMEAERRLHLAEEDNADLRRQANVLKERHSTAARERDAAQQRARDAAKERDALSSVVEEFISGIDPVLRTTRGRVVTRGRSHFAVRFGRDTIRAKRTVEDVLSAADEIGGAEVMTGLEYCGPAVARTFIADPYAAFAVEESSAAPGFRMVF